jgi:hypothetical protein
MITSQEMFAALREFWAEDEDEAREFLAALREVADRAVDNMEAGDEYAFRMIAVHDVLTAVIKFQRNQPVLLAARPPVSAKERLMVAAAERDGLTITSAAELLGVSRWTARTILGELRDAGDLHVTHKGRGSRWLLTLRDAA